MDYRKTRKYDPGKPCWAWGCDSDYLGLRYLRPLMGDGRSPTSFKAFLISDGRKLRCRIFRNQGTQRTGLRRAKFSSEAFSGQVVEGIPPLLRANHGFSFGIEYRGRRLDETFWKEFLRKRGLAYVVYSRDLSTRHEILTRSTEDIFGIYSGRIQRQNASCFGEKSERARLGGALACDFDFFKKREVASITGERCSENSGESSSQWSPFSEEVIEGQESGPYVLPESSLLMLRFPLSTTETARVLGVKPCRLRYLLDCGLVAPPLILGRRAWDRIHIEVAAEHLDARFMLLKNLGELGKGRAA